MAIAVKPITWNIAVSEELLASEGPHWVEGYVRERFKDYLNSQGLRAVNNAVLTVEVDRTAAIYRYKIEVNVTRASATTTYATGTYIPGSYVNSPAPGTYDSEAGYFVPTWENMYGIPKEKKLSKKEQLQKEFKTLQEVWK